MSTSNKFNNLKAMMRDTYAQKMDDPRDRATAELYASKDPKKFLKDKSYLSLKGKKGVAV